jgi:hypothetical protein
LLQQADGTFIAAANSNEGGSLVGWDPLLDLYEQKSTGEIPVCSVLRYSYPKKLLLHGSVTGILSTYAVPSMSPVWSSLLHDGSSGPITGVCSSFDDLYLLSVGIDGNFFVYKREGQAGEILGN